ncbi:hypothetical protein V2A60_001843 [Cordyceps javanica]|uniref:Uncharacterized protein n=1 Tax=Cordyceps javanica TaxID=43265 RepID=A0A545WDG4_9HYPO|nr:hypothetical protein IF1G_00733 [Cordyceps javanica]TQW11982.1 hypothetical protein IF2G_00713 [Cordyceps javanica]
MEQQTMQREVGGTIDLDLVTKDDATAADEEDSRGEKERSPPELNRERDDENSFLEDTVFTNNEQENSEGLEMELRSVASFLDQIEGLLMPLPNVPNRDLSHTMPDRVTRLETLKCESHSRLPPIPPDPALEEALPWAPLPPRQKGPFETETIIARDNHSRQSAQGNRQNHIDSVGTIGTIKDGEVEECAETKKPTRPQPAPSNPLDLLIRRRLQRSVSERALLSNALSLPSKTEKPILPRMDDPGATSKLVSAFMTLRGVKSQHSNMK